VAPPGAPAGRRRAASLVWFFACLSRPYPLSIAFGSSLDARQAGSRQATAATKIIVAVTTATVDTSVGPTPNNSDAISRCRPKAPASPITTPTPARRRPPSSRGRARWTADWVSPFQNVAANLSRCPPQATGSRRADLSWTADPGDALPRSPIHRCRMRINPDLSHCAIWPGLPENYP
jgi:hypothetical protein